MDEYAQILTNVSARENIVQSRMARIQKLDQLIAREARRQGQPPASPKIEQARQNIIDALVKRITHAPETDLSSYYDKLDQIDALISNRGVPTPPPAGMAPAPSLKPALPQLTQRAG